MADLDPRAPLDTGYWQSLGMEGDQAQASTDPFSGPPPGEGQDPFSGHDDLPSGRSSYVPVWLTTNKGIEFIDVFIGEAPERNYSHELIFLYEVVKGRWNVGRVPAKSIADGRWIAEDQEYEQARSLAEHRAMAVSVDAGGNADWRLGPPSEGQRNLLARIGLAEALTKGQASDSLNQHFGSQTLDPSFAEEDTR